MSKANEALDRMAENARELGLDYEPDGMHHNKPQKRPQNCGTGYCSCIECVMEPAQEPAPLRDAMVANLVREGINKHKARELADHFINLTNAQQEPVALEEYDAGLLNDFGGGNVEWWWDYIRAELGRAYEHYQSQMTTPQPAQQEPFGYGRIWWDAKMFVPTLPSVRDGGWLPLYTSPPAQRTWVGLTDEEILKFQDIVPNTLSYDLIEFANAIEAKLKEKNT